MCVNTYNIVTAVGEFEKQLFIDLWGRSIKIIRFKILFLPHIYYFSQINFLILRKFKAAIKPSVK